MSRSRTPCAIAGQTAFVTGAARGIGLATARALGRAGLRVAVGDLEEEAAADAAASVGPAAVGVALDVTSHASFADAVSQVEERLGPIDVLVNNAGIMPIGPFVAESGDTAERMVDVNVHGVLTGMRLVLPGMLERRSGHVVNIASSAARIGFPGGATYAGTKWMVLGVSEGVRAELHGTGVEVSCVLPGVVNTELTSGLHTPWYVKEIQPEDVAAAIVQTLHRPRFEVWVPRALGWNVHASNTMPRAMREAITRLLRADRFLLDHDSGAREAYEDRVGDRRTHV